MQSSPPLSPFLARNPSTGRLCAARLLAWLTVLLIVTSCSQPTPQNTHRPTSTARLLQTGEPAASQTAIQTHIPTGTATVLPSPPATRFASTATTAPPKPTRTSTAAAVCTATRGKIVTAELDTDLLRLPLQFRVYLPPCYAGEPDRRYPVLYLFHGQSSTDDQWDRLGADETADRLIAAGQIPPLLIVMPYDRYGGQPTETNFSQAIVELLIPYIDDTYATEADRRHRAVGGLSRGAGWSVHFAAAHWKLFGKFGAHSPAVFHTDAPRLRTWLDQIPAGSYPRAYVDIGDKDRPEITRSALWLEALLDEYDLPHEWHLFAGYHAEEYWSEHLEGYLRWYTADW